MPPKLRPSRTTTTLFETTSRGGFGERGVDLGGAIVIKRLGWRPHRVANPAGSLALLGPTTGPFQPPFDVPKRSQRPPAELSSVRYCSANRRNGSVQYQVRIPLGSP